MKKILSVLTLSLLLTGAAFGDDEAAEFEKWLTKAVHAIRQSGWTGIEMARESKGEKQFYRVSQISPDSPAAKAGVQAGDVLLSMNGVSLLENEYWAALKAGKVELKPGNTFSFVVSRNQDGEWSKEKVSLKLQDPPDDYVARLIGTKMMMKLGLIEKK